jgi:hypothetical protein
MQPALEPTSSGGLTHHFGNRTTKSGAGGAKPAVTE